LHDTTQGQELLRTLDGLLLFGLSGGIGNLWGGDGFSNSSHDRNSSALEGAGFELSDVNLSAGRQFRFPVESCAVYYTRKQKVCQEGAEKIFIFSAKISESFPLENFGN